MGESASGLAFYFYFYIITVFYIRTEVMNKEGEGGVESNLICSDRRRGGQRSEVRR